MFRRVWQTYAAAMSLPVGLLNNNLGAPLMGGFVATFLYGIFALQCVLFFQHTTKSTPIMTYTVWLLCVINTAHIAFVIHPVYWYTVRSFGNPIMLLEMIWSISAGVFATGVSDAVVRAWFIYRIWIFSSRSVPLVLTLVFAASSLFCFTMAFGVRVAQQKLVIDPDTVWYVYTVTGMAVAVDCMLTVSLCFYIRRARQHFNRRTESILNLVLTYTISSGLLTSTCASLCFITFSIFPHETVFYGFFFPLSNCYTNSLLATFNTRDWLKQDDAPKITTVPLSRLNTSRALTESPRASDVVEISRASDPDSKLEVSNLGEKLV